jgi:hypothetical protein
VHLRGAIQLRQRLPRRRHREHQLRDRVAERTGDRRRHELLESRFASVVSLLNDRLIGAGKSVLGFLNPFLYSTSADALNDITQSRMQHEWFSCDGGMGPCESISVLRPTILSLFMTTGDWSGHTELDESVDCRRAVIYGLAETPLCRIHTVFDHFYLLNNKITKERDRMYKVYCVYLLPLPLSRFKSIITVSLCPGLSSLRVFVRCQPYLASLFPEPFDRFYPLLIWLNTCPLPKSER